MIKMMKSNIMKCPFPGSVHNITRQCRIFYGYGMKFNIWVSTWNFGTDGHVDVSREDPGLQFDQSLNLHPNIMHMYASSECSGETVRRLV